MSNRAAEYDLPEAPEGAFWHVDTYIGNYDDGVYFAPNDRVLIRLCRQSPFAWVHAFTVEGTQRLIATPDKATVRVAAESILNQRDRSSVIFPA